MKEREAVDVRMYGFRDFLKKASKYFFEGAIIMGPIALAIFVMWKILEFLDGIIPVKVPGLGIIILVILITLIGYFANLMVGRYVFATLQSLLQKIPLISFVYNTVRQLADIFSGDKKGIGEPALIILTEKPLVMKPGFIVGEKDDMAIVLLPHSFNYSGNIFIVEKKNVVRVSVPQGLWFQIIISGGIFHGEKLSEAIKNENVKN